MLILYLTGSDLSEEDLANNALPSSAARGVVSAVSVLHVHKCAACSRGATTTQALPPDDKEPHTSGLKLQL